MLDLMSTLAGASAAWDNTAMSGTAKRTTPWIDLGDQATEVSWHVRWTNGANVLGAFEVEQTNIVLAEGAAVAGVAMAISSPTVNNNNGDAIVGVTSRCKYARLIYTNTSGTGTLTNPTAQVKKR